MHWHWHWHQDQLNHSQQQILSFLAFEFSCFSFGSWFYPYFYFNVKYWSSICLISGSSSRSSTTIAAALVSVSYPGRPVHQQSVRTCWSACPDSTLNPVTQLLLLLPSTLTYYYPMYSVHTSSSNDMLHCPIGRRTRMTKLPAPSAAAAAAWHAALHYSVSVVAFPLFPFLSVQQQIGLPICSGSLSSLSLSARTDVYQAVHLSPPPKQWLQFEQY